MILKLNKFVNLKKKYLEKNGYGLGMISRQRFFSEIEVSPSTGEVKKMITLFQKLHHLNVTGEFDEQTIIKMKSPSCANPDILVLSNFSRLKRSFENLEFKWTKNKLSYKILNFDTTLKEYTKYEIQINFNLLS